MTYSYNAMSDLFGPAGSPAKLKVLAPGSLGASAACSHVRLHTRAVTTGPVCRVS